MAGTSDGVAISGTDSEAVWDGVLAIGRVAVVVDPTETENGRVSVEGNRCTVADGERARTREAEPELVEECERGNESVSETAAAVVVSNGNVCVGDDGVFVTISRVLVRDDRVRDATSEVRDWEDRVLDNPSDWVFDENVIETSFSVVVRGSTDAVRVDAVAVAWGSPVRDSVDCVRVNRSGEIVSVVRVGVESTCVAVGVTTVGVFTSTMKEEPANVGGGYDCWHPSVVPESQIPPPIVSQHGVWGDPETLPLVPLVEDDVCPLQLVIVLLIATADVDVVATVPLSSCAIPTMATLFVLVWQMVVRALDNA
mmetsp:Transcript_25342/g.78225  ORF Transcript_25342/g.78225 Transcript_25342/m.78225 type:complete len:312 (+) Transcript_25342:1232-2167(+)